MQVTAICDGNVVELHQPVHQFGMDFTLVRVLVHTGRQ